MPCYCVDCWQKKKVDKAEKYAKIDGYGIPGDCMGEDPRFFPLSMLLGFDPVRDVDHPYYTLRIHRYDDGLIRMEVPQDFRTDLTTHPKHLHWYLLALCPIAFFFPVFLWVMVGVSIMTIWVRDPLGRHQRAALFHDYNYRQQSCSRYTADAVYLTMLREDGVGLIRSHLHYTALRLLGWIAWTHNSRKGLLK